MKEKKLFINIFIVFASFFMLFILSNSQVFASSDKFSFVGPNDIVYEVPIFSSLIGSNDYFINSDSDGHGNITGFSLYILSDKSNCYVTDKWLCFKKPTDIVFYRFFIGGDKWVYQNKWTGFNSSGFCGIDNFVYSSFDIKDINGKIFFQPAKEVKETVLVPIAQSMDFLAVTKEILGILPIILVVLIGLLGLMKAIRQMLKMLRQA